MLCVFVAGGYGAERYQADIKQPTHACLEDCSIGANDQIRTGRKREADEQVVDAEFYL